MNNFKKKYDEFVKIINEEIKVKCGWCGKDLGTRPGKASPGFENEVSHGICKDCLKTWDKDLDDEKENKDTK